VSQTPAECIPYALLTPSMSSSSAYYLSSRHSDSEEEWTVSNSPSTDISQRGDDDSVGTEEFSALRHPGYEWVDPWVKLPLLGLVSLQP